MKPVKKATLLIVGAVSLALLSCNPEKSSFINVETNASKNSGVEGLVLRGPIHGGPVQMGEASEEGFKALFYVRNNEKFVTTFQSDENGTYHVALSPGTYEIIPDAAAPIM